MKNVKAQVLGNAYPKSDGCSPKGKLHEEIISYISSWKKACLQMGKELGTLEQFDLSDAPVFGEEGLFRDLEGVTAIQNALTTTAFNWLKGGSSERANRRILAGCIIQLDRAWVSRASWLAEESIVNLRQQFQQLLRKLKGLAQWKFWDGMEDIVVQCPRDRTTGNIIPEEIDMTGIDTEGLGQEEVEKLKKQVSLTIKAKQANRKLLQVRLEESHMQTAKRIMQLVVAEGVGTINLGTENHPAWALTPAVKEAFELALQVSV